MKENKKARVGLLLVLPILALPFLTFGFWALGGGRSSGGKMEKGIGINSELPDAKPDDDSALDKMAFYDQAEKAAGKDAIDSLNDRTDSLDGSLGTSSFEDARINSSGYSGSESGHYGMNQNEAGQNETRIRERMQQLQHQLDVQSGGEYPGEEFNHTSRLPYNQMDENSSSTTLPALATSPDTTDAEMEQLQNMMNRIYDVQHPDEVSSRLKASSQKNRGMVYPVTISVPENSIHLLTAKGIENNDSSNKIQKTPSQFYGLPSDKTREAGNDKSIRAITQQDQVLVNGASIKLRLQQVVYVNGLLVPKETLLTGQVQLSNDRLQVEVMSILSGQNLVQVKLSAYDTDGMEGLNIPGSINGEVIRQTSDNTLQGIGAGTLNPSIGAQAAMAGLETAKTLFSRKLKLTKVFVKAGHQLLLKNQ